MANCKHTQWILETIDHLRKRKARPDLGRICHVLKRRHGLSAQDTETKLEKLVDGEIVVKVDYKGNTSYRNAAKWRKSLLGCAIMNSTYISTKILEAIISVSKTRLLTKSGSTEAAKEQVGDVELKEAARKTGATYSMVNSWLQKNCEGFANLKSPMVVVIQREVEAGRIKRMDDGHYVITPEQMKSIQGDVIKPLKSASKTDLRSQISPPRTDRSDDATRSAGGGGENVSRQNDRQTASLGGATRTEAPPPAKRGRPPKNRVKLAAPNSTHTSPSLSRLTQGSGNSCYTKLKRPISECGDGADSEIPAKMSKITKKNTHQSESVCDFCNGTYFSNSLGLREKLLCCKDCTANGHPSCMNYSSLLAKRALRGPWQCMNCKTCCLCDDAGKPDKMLFCDGCDRGYHMHCHQPSILKKPAGKWECSSCELEDSVSNKHTLLAQHRLGHGTNTVPMNLIQAYSPLTCIKTNFQDPLIQTGDSYPDASSWTVDDVVEYLDSQGFTEEAKTFKEQEIDGVALLLLKRADVLKGLELKLGPALKINRHIQGLQSARKTL